MRQSYHPDLHFWCEQRVAPPEGDRRRLVVFSRQLKARMADLGSATSEGRRGESRACSMGGPLDAAHPNGRPVTKPATNRGTDQALRSRGPRVLISLAEECSETHPYWRA